MIQLMNKELIVATTNAAKLDEIRLMLNDGGFCVLGLGDIGDYDQAIEDGGSFEANAAIKALALSKKINKPVLADDSGLCVDYMDNEPGVDSALFMGEDTPYSIRCAEILRRLDCANDNERGAKFVCVMALAMPDTDDVIYTKGEIHGQIAKEPAGGGGFGYDPIFFVPQFNKTLAELSSDEKNKISHRGQALRLMADRLKQI